MSIDYVRLEFRFLFTYVAAVALRCDRSPVFRPDCNTFLSFHSRRSRFEEGPRLFFNQLIALGRRAGPPAPLPLRQDLFVSIISLVKLYQNRVSFAPCGIALDLQGGNDFESAGSHIITPPVPGTDHPVAFEVSLAQRASSMEACVVQGEELVLDSEDGESPPFRADHLGLPVADFASVSDPDKLGQSTPTTSERVLPADLDCLFRLGVEVLLLLFEEPLLKSLDLLVALTNHVQLSLRQLNSCENHVLDMVHVGLCRVPRMDFDKVLEVFLEVFDLRDYVPSEVLHLDREHVVVDAEQHLKVGLEGLQLGYVELGDFLRERPLLLHGRPRIDRQGDQQRRKRTNTQL